MAKPKKVKVIHEEKAESEMTKLTDLEKRILSYEPDYMIDDHGFAIIGDRQKAPVHEDK